MPESASTATTSEAKLQTFIAKLDSANQKLVKALRTALRKRFPTANELVYDYSFALVIGYAPAENGIDAIFALRASDAGVSFYFSQGPKLSDPKKLLKGSAKQTRFITIESANQLKDPDVEALIGATLAQARLPFPASGKGALIIKSDNSRKKPARKAAKKS